MFAPLQTFIVCHECIIVKLTHYLTVVQLIFQPLEYRVREEEGRLPLTIIQIGESERPVLFSVVYNETTSTATSMAEVIHKILQLSDSEKEDGIQY